LTVPASAKHFANSYVSFDLPDDWACDLEGTEWVCKPPPDANGKSGMIAILTAKFIGPYDSPQLYKEHIEEVGHTKGNRVVAQPEDTLIGRAIWLDASVRNSEVPNYTTRYLARTEGNIGVLVTFSFHSSIEARAKAISDLIAGNVVVDHETALPGSMRR
jgi:hypothetical protein